MENVFMLLLLTSLVLLILGFFSPKTSLFWDKKNIPTKKRSFKIYGIIVLVCFVLVGASNKKKNSNKTNSESKEIPESLSIQEKEITSSNVSIGQVLHTDYFDIVANNVSLKNKVDTGNQFANLKPEPGNMYLIINASFKNTDNESRMLTDGSVWINYNGKDYEFDKSETIMIEGWGLLLDQINPLTTKTTNLVYKIPEEITGTAYWQPGRADNDERISLGNL